MYNECNRIHFFILAIYNRIYPQKKRKKRRKYWEIAEFIIKNEFSTSIYTSNQRYRFNRDLIILLTWFVHRINWMNKAIYCITTCKGLFSLRCYLVFFFYLFNFHLCDDCVCVVMSAILYTDYFVNQLKIWHGWKFWWAY